MQDPSPSRWQAAVRDFVHHLAVERACSPHTVEAYRRDLELLERWLAATHERPLVAAGEADLHAYFAARHAGSQPTSANRRLTVFKRYFRWALRERLLTVDHLEDYRRLLPFAMTRRMPVWGHLPMVEQPASYAAELATLALALAEQHEVQN